jgi:hypothetical protein
MAKNGNGKAALAAAEEAFAEDAGMGYEEVDKEHLQIPFIRPLQALSPQLKKNDPAFISGASQGNIFNTVTNQVWDGDEGVVVLPVYFQMKYLEFVPRMQGGGFVSELSPDSAEVRNAVRDRDSGMTLLANGNELVNSAQHWVQLVHDDGALESAIIDMKKTQLSRSRRWNSLMMSQNHNGQRMPPWCNTYLLRTVEDGNDKGSWYSWVITQKDRTPIEEYATSPLTISAKELHSTIKAGALQIAPPSPEVSAGITLDDDAPF